MFTSSKLNTFIKIHKILDAEKQWQNIWDKSHSLTFNSSEKNTGDMVC